MHHLGFQRAGLGVEGSGHFQGRVKDIVRAFQQGFHLHERSWRLVFGVWRSGFSVRGVGLGFWVWGFGFGV